LHLLTLPARSTVRPAPLLPRHASNRRFPRREQSDDGAVRGPTSQNSGRVRAASETGCLRPFLLCSRMSFSNSFEIPDETAGCLDAGFAPGDFVGCQRLPSLSQFQPGLGRPPFHSPVAASLQAAPSRIKC
jgi:hypothetical protein